MPWRSDRSPRDDITGKRAERGRQKGLNFQSFGEIPAKHERVLEVRSAAVRLSHTGPPYMACLIKNENKKQKAKPLFLGVVAKIWSQCMYIEFMQKCMYVYTHLSTSTPVAFFLCFSIFSLGFDRYLGLISLFFQFSTCGGDLKVDFSTILHREPPPLEVCSGNLDTRGERLPVYRSNPSRSALSDLKSRVFLVRQVSLITIIQEMWN